MQSEPSHFRGLRIIRGLVVKHHFGAGGEAADHFMATRYGQAELAGTKAAVSAIGSGDIGTRPVADFMDLVKERSVFGQLPWRKTPFDTRVLRVTAGARGFWVRQGNPVPLSKLVLDGARLEPLSVSAITVTTKESMLGDAGVVESGLRRDLARAIELAVDEALLDPANAGVADESPASIANGATTIAATGDTLGDLKTLIAVFGGDFAAARFVTDPKTATNLAILQDSAGAFVFPDLGPNGGSLLGIPVMTTTASPITTAGGQLVLVDASGIAFGYGGAKIDTAEHAAIAMSDDPAAPSSVVSLWQCGCVGWRVDVQANWRIDRDNSVVVLSGVGG